MRRIKCQQDGINMGKLINNVDSTTEHGISKNSPMGKSLNVAANGSEIVQDAITLASRAVVLSLSKLWIGIGIVRPATTEESPLTSRGTSVFKQTSYGDLVKRHESPYVYRFDESKMWFMKLGDYFLPLSQTYTASAKKRLNVSSLVDGIDIIQQTRKEAKTVDCSIRISVNENQKNLQLLDGEKKITELAKFLADLYESDAVFEINNPTLNDTFGLEYVIMTSYKFMPKAGSKTYIFEFALTEVKFGDNVLTFDENQLIPDTQV